MSRIHEALKKAEQERATVQPAELDGVTPAASADPVRPSDADTFFAETVARHPSNLSGSDFLRFDDLRARCAHPEWHLDPNVNVFTNSALMAHGAEQFRTLRSRLYQMKSAQTLKALLVTSSRCV